MSAAAFDGSYLPHVAPDRLRLIRSLPTVPIEPCLSLVEDGSVVTPVAVDGSVVRSETPDHTVGRMRALGLFAGLHATQPCVLPEHEHPARVRWDRRGFPLYVCEAGTWGLAEVRAHLAYGRVVSVSQLEASRWRERLDYEAGLRVPSVVPLHVPDGAPDNARAVGQGVALFLGLRGERWPREEPFTFARSFCMAYCDLSDMDARRGIDWLADAGLVIHEGWTKGRGHPAKRWVLPSWAARTEADS